MGGEKFIICVQKLAFAAVDVAQLVEYLPHIHEVLVFIPRTAENWVVAHTRNTSILETEVETLEVKGLL